MLRLFSLLVLCFIATCSFAEDDIDELKTYLEKNSNRPWAPGDAQTTYDMNVLLLAVAICENPHRVWEGWYPLLSKALKSIKGTTNHDDTKNTLEIIHALHAWLLPDTDPKKVSTLEKYQGELAQLFDLQRDYLAVTKDAALLYEAALAEKPDIRSPMDPLKRDYLERAAELGHTQALSYLGAHLIVMENQNDNPDETVISDAFYKLVQSAHESDVAVTNLLSVLNHYSDDLKKLQEMIGKAVSLAKKKTKISYFFQAYDKFLKGDTEEAQKMFAKSGGQGQDLEEYASEICSVIQKSRTPETRVAGIAELEASLGNQNRHTTFDPILQRALFEARYDAAFDLATQVSTPPGRDKIEIAQSFMAATDDLQITLHAIDDNFPINSIKRITDKIRKAKFNLSEDREALWTRAREVLTEEKITQTLGMDDADYLLENIGLLGLAHAANGEPRSMCLAATLYYKRAKENALINESQVAKDQLAALKWFRKVFEIDEVPKKIRELSGTNILEILVDQSSDDLTEALKVYEDVIKINPNIEFSADVLEFLGDFLLSMKSFDTAAELLEQAANHTFWQTSVKGEFDNSDSTQVLEKYGTENRYAYLMLRTAGAKTDAIKKKRMLLKEPTISEEEKLKLEHEIASHTEGVSDWSRRGRKLYEKIGNNKKYSALRNSNGDPIVNEYGLKKFIGISFIDQHHVEPDKNFDQQAYRVLSNVPFKHLSGSLTCLEFLSNWHLKSKNFTNARLYLTAIFTSETFSPAARSRAARRLATLYSQGQLTRSNKGLTDEDAIKELLELSISFTPTGVAFYDIARLFEKKPEEAAALYVTAGYFATHHDEKGVTDILVRALSALDRLLQADDITHDKKTILKLSRSYLMYLQDNTVDSDGLFRSFGTEELSDVGAWTLPSSKDATAFIKKLEAWQNERGIQSQAQPSSNTKHTNQPFLNSDMLELPTALPQKVCLSIAERCADKALITQAIKWYKRAAFSTKTDSKHIIYGKAGPRLQQALAQDIADCATETIRQNSFAFHQEAAKIFLAKAKESTGEQRRNLLRGLVTIYHDGIPGVCEMDPEKYIHKAFTWAQEIEHDDKEGFLDDPQVMLVLSKGYTDTDPEKSLMYAMQVFESKVSTVEHKAAAAFMAAKLYNSNKVRIDANAKAEEKYAEWLQKSIDAFPSFDVLNLLAACHENGFGVEKSITNSIALRTQSVLVDFGQEKAAKERFLYWDHVKTLPDAPDFSEDEKAFARLCNLYLDTVENIGLDLASALATFTDEQLTLFIQNMLIKQVSPIAQLANGKLIVTIQTRLKTQRQGN